MQVEQPLAGLGLVAQTPEALAEDGSGATPWLYGALAAGVVALGVVSVMVPTRATLRSRPTP